MNADDLKSLPQFIEGSDCAMLRVGANDFGFAGHVYVRLSDAAALLAKTIYQDKVKYISVGMGGIKLYEMAKRNGWTLFTYNLDDTMSGGWRGDSHHRQYYIKANA